MNFGTYLPGKFLGSTLIVANKTDSEQIIELSVDGMNYKYKKDELVKRYPDIKKVTPERLNQAGLKTKDQILPFCIDYEDK